MNKELRIKTLIESNKKIEDLKNYNIPVTLKNIAELKKKGAQEQFIREQEVRLEKLEKKIKELEEKKVKILAEMDN